MYSFDASSMIHVWDNYPPSNLNFNSLWTWIAEQIENKDFSISKKALEEVGHKVPECGQWLREHNIQEFALTSLALKTAQSIKISLNIEEEKYGKKGVGENDLFIIAIAKETNTTLISEESKQNKLPKLKSGYKIPAVCALPDVAVQCISFVELLKLPTPDNP
jgi:predicted nucleic acid-binding protein